MNATPATKARPSALAPKGCSSLKLRQLSRRVGRQFDEDVGQAGLKTTQYSLLTCIVRMGPLRPGRLADELEMDASTLTRNLKPLIAQGWVVMDSGTDQRSRLIRATETGVAQQALAQKAWKRAQLSFNERLGNDLVVRLHAVLDECLQALRATPGDQS